MSLRGGMLPRAALWAVTRAGDRWSLGPDIQWAEGAWLSRSNLSVTRFGLTTGFRSR
jgi:hypothetical protein